VNTFFTQFLFFCPIEKLILLLPLESVTFFFLFAMSGQPERYFFWPRRRCRLSFFIKASQTPSGLETLWAYPFFFACVAPLSPHPLLLIASVRRLFSTSLDLPADNFFRLHAIPSVLMNGVPCPKTRSPFFFFFFRGTQEGTAHFPNVNRWQLLVPFPRPGAAPLPGNRQNPPPPSDKLNFKVSFLCHVWYGLKFSPSPSNLPSVVFFAERQVDVSPSPF